MSKKLTLGIMWSMAWQINTHIKIARFFHYKVPVVGRGISMVLDRFLLFFYAIDIMSFSINVRYLSIPHPCGVLLGGNGIFSEGRVVIMAGVKLGGRSPKDPEYLKKHSEQRVFELGDNVVIGTGSIILGPVKICDNVTIAAMSLVNKSIEEPGIYVGIPVKKVSDNINFDWVGHLPIPDKV